MNNQNNIKETRKQLDNIYEVLHQDKNKIIELLSLYDMSLQVGFFPFHSFKENNEFYLEQYPIPVITVGNFMDIGIDIEKVFFEFKFTIKEAIEFDFHIFGDYTFEVYGVDDYYEDYYFDNIDEIKQNLESSNETEIGISILIDKENLVEDTENVIKMLSEKLLGVIL